MSYQNFFWREGGGGALGFFMKKDQREKKGNFTRYVDFLKLLKFSFDRIFMPPPKHRLGYIGLHSFVSPVVTLFSSLRHTFKFCSDRGLY